MHLGNPPCQEGIAPGGYGGLEGLAINIMMAFPTGAKINS